PETRAALIKLARLKRILSAEDCEDIASEAIRQAMRKQREYDPSRVSVRTFMMRICENVIGSYRRKRSGKKRKAEGGVISIDASSGDEGDNRTEPVDEIAETQRSLTKQIQHYIESAKLSKKEAQAIASRRDKRGKEPGVRFSSSTGRRATRKMRQVRADEEFHEPPEGPDLLECAYGNIPAAERNAAVLFDQLRRTKWFVAAIDDWRKSAEWSNARAFLQKQAALKRFPLRILDPHLSEQLRSYRQAVYERDYVLHRQFEGAVDITLA